MKRTLLATTLLATLSTLASADNAVTSTTVTPTATTTTTTTTTPATTPAIAPAQQPVVINCKYHIPAETTTIDHSLISTWAGKAAVQSFDFNPASIDAELTELKYCYTDQGWQGFNEALQKSGNIEAIKSQHLTVSSLVDGEVKITPVKDNQWKATVPLQVVYQNDKQKLTQLLVLDLLIGRKISGDLGIMQMIAIPRQTNQAAPGSQAPAQE
jgi:hypothetical protein